MNRTGVVLLKSFVALSVLTWLVGCGGGGGGSGLQTTLRGNIRSAPAGSAPSATPTTMAKLRPDRLWSVLLELWEAKSFAQVPGIGISVPDASMTTDAGGSFRLSTSHFGPGVVHFTGNGLDVSLPVTVPAGGELLLQDIDLTQSQATVRRPTSSPTERLSRWRAQLRSRWSSSVRPYFLTRRVRRLRALIYPLGPLHRLGFKEMSMRKATSRY